MKRLLSGIQPSGQLHLGNYFGMMSRMIHYQKENDLFAFIVNYHALTSIQNREILRENTFSAACDFLALGLDPEKSTFWIQGDVPQVTELTWLLSNVVNVGLLQRSTSYKDKIAQGVASNMGLFSYPILMAADILLFGSEKVPIGKDQKQHLELTRDLAGAFNRRFGVEYFKLPEPMIVKDVKRIMSLQDGERKMSKSDESDLSRINLTDSPELILKKIKKAKTDSESFISFDENRKEIYNLLNIFSATSNKTPQELAKEYENLGNGKFKNDLAESLIEHLKPIQERLKQFEEDKSYIDKILKSGSEKAQEIANKTKNEIFEIIGLK